MSNSGLVWLLSVDLQTRTATFTTGLGEAARAARGTFGEISGGAGRMGKETSFSMKEARHSVMMLGEEFGVRLPRAISGFLAGLGPMGPALEAAFPFLAIITLAGILIEHLRKLREEGKKLTEDQEKFRTAVENAFNALDDKILTAQKRADELRGDHLGALHKELELIDHQSMNELVKSFAEVAKAADAVFKGLESHWYKFGIGSDGAKNALDQFQAQYDGLMAKGDEAGASGLLHGTLDQAQKILAAFDQLKASQIQMGPHADNSHADYQKALAARNTLTAAGLKGTEDERRAQEMLVQALRDQEEIERRIATLKGLEKGNATTATNKEMGKEAQDAARKHGEALIKYNEAVNKMMADDEKQALDGERQYWRNSIDAAENGSDEKLRAIDAALSAEEAAGHTANEFYRGLLNQRLQIVRQMAQEEARAHDEAARAQLQHDMRMGSLRLEAAREQMDLYNSARLVKEEERVQQELALAQEEYSIKFHALQDEANALDHNGRDYEARLKTIQDRQKELVREHENEITAIKDAAEKARNQRILAAEVQMREQIAQGLTQVIMGHQSFGQMMNSLGEQVATGMLQNSLRYAMGLDKERPHEAAAAARKAFLAGMHLPFPVNLVAAPVLAAGAFAAVMAFEKGGIVSGVGRGDVVPAMLTPGEAVLPKNLTEGLQRAANSGMGSGPSYTVHVRPVYNVQTLDSGGFQKVLDAHSTTLQRHLEGTIRKMNR